jgi:hypothetical protein
MFSSDEQMKSALKQMAENSKHFYDHLRNQGFSEGHAFLLTREWLRGIMGGIKQEG